MRRVGLGFAGLVVFTMIAAAACSSKHQVTSTGAGPRHGEWAPIDPPDPAVGAPAGSNKACGTPGQCGCTAPAAGIDFEFCGQCPTSPATPCSYCMGGDYCPSDPCDTQCYSAPRPAMCPAAE